MTQGSTLHFQLKTRTVLPCNSLRRFHCQSHAVSTCYGYLFKNTLCIVVVMFTTTAFNTLARNLGTNILYADDSSPSLFLT